MDEMRPAFADLLALLSDGRFHSGEGLGRTLGVSRATVWSAVRALRGFGLDIHAVRGRGYRLAKPLELLDYDVLLHRLEVSSRSLLSGLEVHQEIGSTNQHLMEGAARGLPKGYVCLAEMQTRGRGRRGRAWVSPFGSNVYLSVLWRFGEGPARLAGLSLAMGVAVVRALAALGVRDVGLKWPNDVIWRGGKLAGILLEVAGESSGPCHAVVGVGINLNMSAGEGVRIGQPWADLASSFPSIGRNQLATELIHQLLLGLAAYEHSGLETFQREWGASDVLMGRVVSLHLPEGVVTGVAGGVDGQGALVVEVGGVRRLYTYGEVTVRAAE